MRSLTRSIVLAALPASMLAVVAAGPAQAGSAVCLPQATQWKAVDLGSFDTATGINEQGVIVGSKVANPGKVPQRNVAVKWQDGKLTELGYLLGSQLRGPNSVATGVDDQGRVSGYSTALDGQRHAFVHRNGLLRDLGEWGVYSQANAIGNGVVAGYIENKDLAGDVLRKRQSAIWEGSGYGLPPGGAGSQIVDINESGDWVGSTGLSFDTSAGAPPANRTERGYARVDNEVPRDLGTLGGNWTTPSGINDLGQVVGESATDQAGNYQGAFIWDATTGMRPLPGANPGFFVKATAINGKGEIIGSYTCEDDISGPAVWPSPETAPSALPLADGAVDAQLRDINDRGDIVGSSVYTDGSIRATLWVKQT